MKKFRSVPGRGVAESDGEFIFIDGMDQVSGGWRLSLNNFAVSARELLSDGYANKSVGNLMFSVNHSASMLNSRINQSNTEFQVNGDAARLELMEGMIFKPKGDQANFLTRIVSKDDELRFEECKLRFHLCSSWTDFWCTYLCVVRSGGFSRIHIHIWERTLAIQSVPATGFGGHTETGQV